MRRVRVTFVGFEPFWMQVLTDVLSKRHAEDLECSWMVWPSTMRERLAFVREMLRTDVVVRVGMPFEFQSETNRAWLAMVGMRPGLKGVNYWIGSDVLDFQTRSLGGRIGPRETAAIARLRHFAGTEQLRSELVALGVPATTVVLPSPEWEYPDVPPPLPDRFTVLSYWTDPRFEFYGGKELFAAARALPDARFEIVGAEGLDRDDVPPNVAFHGRVADVRPFYAAATVLVRLAEHDSVPGSMVEEAMLFGRHVVYSFAWPHTTLVPSGDSEALIGALRDLMQRDRAGALRVNQQGREFALHDYDPDRRAQALRDAIVVVAND